MSRHLHYFRAQQLSRRECPPPSLHTRAGKNVPQVSANIRMYEAQYAILLICHDVEADESRPDRGNIARKYQISN